MLARIAIAASALTLVACQSMTGTPAAPAATAAAPPPPAWQQGRSPEQANSTLAPHAAKMTVTPESEIPVASLKVPEGIQGRDVGAAACRACASMARGNPGTI